MKNKLLLAVSLLLALTSVAFISTTNADYDTVEDRTAYREARQAERETLLPIIEKNRAGEELTEEEQTLLDEFRASGNAWNWSKMWGKRGGWRMWSGTRNGLGDGTGECIYE